MEEYDYKLKQIVINKVPKNLVGERSLTESQVLEVAKAAKSIEEAYGVPIDLEFCVEKGTNKMYVTQTRPLTGSIEDTIDVKLPNIPQNKILARSKNIRKPGGPYVAPIIVVREIDHVNRSYNIDGDLIALNKQYKDGYILVTPEVPPQLEQHLSNCKAIYATECGTTGHAAAVAAEKGIIYLGRGVNTIPMLEVLNTGMTLGIAVSKTEGIVYLVNKKK